MGDSAEAPSSSQQRDAIANESSLITPPADQHVGDQYEVPAVETHSSFDSLKQRIRHHYELASDYYYSLWLVPSLSPFPPTDRNRACLIM